MDPVQANAPLNDFVVSIATQNGSGSQTANQILVKTLFRMGLPVGGKNLFPSNIQGLPTWFTIRAHPLGFTARRPLQDVVVAVNPTTALEDQRQLRPGGLFLHSTDCRLKPEQIRSDVIQVTVPFRDLVAPVSDSIKAKKLLTNLIYVGIFAELLPLDFEVLKGVIQDQFNAKANLIDSNLSAVEAGRVWARDILKDFVGDSPRVPIVRAKSISNGNQGQILIDGNTAAGMGLLDGGCTFAAWYPITPSSSVMESLQEYGSIWRRDPDGRLRLAVVQAEDELSSICMVVGAGWAGARAVTATSGPGLSLMSEAAGLAYFAEVPAVIWNVQRAGPSTGLPTRTMQADVQSAAHLSHGDTRHILLFPSTPAECFEFGRIAFDLAEELQTLVIVMSDLDLGMNLHRTSAWKADSTPFKRGKVLSANELEKTMGFARYSDPEGDGIGTRTLPGTPHPSAAYFTRGTGHDEHARYSEDPAVFAATLDRLNRKWKTARGLVPSPVVDMVPGAKIGLLAYGSSDAAIPESRFALNGLGQTTNYLRLKSYPFTKQIEKFLAANELVYVIEQNRDGQLRQMLVADYPEFASRIKSVVQYDGWPLTADHIVAKVTAQSVASKTEVLR